MNTREAVNQKYSIREAYYLSLGKYPPSGKCFCPFHNNHRTPAAKVYQHHLVCFGECNRKYDSFDLLNKFRSDLVKELKSESVWTLSLRKQQLKEYPSLKGMSLTQVIKTLLNEISI